MTICPFVKCLWHIGLDHHWSDLIWHYLHCFLQVILNVYGNFTYQDLIIMKYHHNCLPKQISFWIPSVVCSASWSDVDFERTYVLARFDHTRFGPSSVVSLISSAKLLGENLESLYGSPTCATSRDEHKIGLTEQLVDGSGLWLVTVETLVTCPHLFFSFLSPSQSPIEM